MPDSEKEYLLLLWEENICPTGGNTIPKGTRVGSGSKSDGGFCGNKLVVNGLSMLG
jgi:hypothetical protein